MPRISTANLVVLAVLTTLTVPGCNTFEDLEAIQLRDLAQDGDASVDEEVADEVGESCGGEICQATEYCCDDTCVPHDENNCGACGVVCDGPRQLCGDTDCVCEPPFANCSDGDEICESDLSRDSVNCGTCGNTCEVGQDCYDGVCDGLKQVATGNEHTCVLFDSGRVFCRGSNTRGQVDGTDSTDIISVTTRVQGLPEIQSISSFHDHTCAVSADNQLYCWGDNSDGQLGQENTDPVTGPVQVEALAGMRVTQVTAGERFTCALVQEDQMSDRQIWCWGTQPSLDETGADTPIVESLIVLDWKDLDGATNHLCAVDAEDTVHCWGPPETWVGTMNGSVVVSLSTTAVDEVDVGSFHSCALSGTTIQCWGETPKLGTNGGVGQPIEGDWSLFSAGGSHSCAVDFLGSNEVSCWGIQQNDVLGTGEVGNAARPSAVAGPPSPDGVVDLSAGKKHTCAIDDEGSLWCWGANGSRQIEANNLDSVGEPLKVTLF